MDYWFVIVVLQDCYVGVKCRSYIDSPRHRCACHPPLLRKEGKIFSCFWFRRCDIFTIGLL